MVYDVIEGTTTPLQFQLVENGAPINLGAITVTLILNNRLGVTVSAPGTVTVTDSLNGIVQLAPTNSSVFVASSGPYYARWKLTTAGSLVGYIPSSIRDVWNIVGT